MYEYEIYNEKKNENSLCYGYNINDMKKRNPEIDWENWKIVSSEYID